MRPRPFFRRPFAPGVSAVVTVLLLAFSALPSPGWSGLGSTRGLRFSCACELRMPCCLVQRCPLGSSSSR